MIRSLITSLRRIAILAPLLGAALSAPLPVHAADGALYGPVAPPGSAFVRVFNGSERPDLLAQVGAQTVDEIPAWGASDYVFVPSGTTTVSIGSVNSSAPLQADHYYTAVEDKGAIKLIDSARFNNRMKALLMVYNLSDSKSLSLKSADGKTDVVAGVSANSVGTREVNPTKATLAVYDGDTKIADAPAVNLTRGKASSLFVVGEAKAPRLVWSSN